MAENKTLRDNQVQNNFRLRKEIDDMLKEIAKEDRRTKLATIEILIENEHKKRKPKK